MLIGSDPELCVLNTNGNKCNELNAIFDHDGEIGWDHNGRVLEIRPAPAATPEELTENVRAIVGVAKDMLPNRYSLHACTAWSMSGMSPEAFGCHFHISDDYHQADWWNGMCQLMSVLVGLPMLAIVADYDSVALRYGSRRQRYGAIDGMRYCQFGSGGHRASRHDEINGMEYRSISGLVMKTPELYNAAATLVMSVAKAYSDGTAFPKKITTIIPIYDRRELVLDSLERLDVWNVLADIAPAETVSLLKGIVDSGGTQTELACISRAWREGA